MFVCILILLQGVYSGMTVNECKIVCVCDASAYPTSSHVCVSFSVCVCVRIEAKHQELRDRQARDRYPTPDMEDDAMDPNYARIHAFRVPSSPPLTLRTHTRSPSPQSPPRPPLHAPGPHLHAPGPAVHSREPSGEDALDGLYAKVNKQRAPAPAPSTDRPDRQTDRER